MLNDDSLVVKSNELIEARYKLSLGEQRLILLLASSIQKDDKEFNTYEIRVADFARMFNLDTSNSLYEKVEEAAKELLGKQLYLKNSGQDFEATVWLSYVKYVRGSGVIKLRFDESLKPYLLQIQESFTQYKLNQVMSFKSSYSIRLYELLKKEAYKAKNKQFERCFSIEAYRSFLGVDDGTYPIFADFRKRVIEPTIREISDYTDLNIFETYTKTGRKITGVCFVVLVRDKEEAQARIENLRLEDTPAPKPEMHPIIEKLMFYGFTLENAKSFKTKYGIKQIERNLAYMMAEDKNGKQPIKNKAGYLAKAIAEDWGNALEAQEQKKKELEAKKKAEAEQKRLQELEEQRKADEQKQRNIQAIEAFLVLPSGLKAIIKKGFLEIIQDHSFKLERWKKVQESKDDSLLKSEPLLRGDFAKFLLENHFIE